MSPVYFNEVNQSLRFLPADTIKKQGILGGGIGAIVMSTIVPYVVKKIPTLFYKPENFIKAYGTTLQYPETPIALGAGMKGESFDLVYKKEGVKTGQVDNNDPSIISSLKFRFDPIQNNSLPGYFAVSLIAYRFEATQVKLKSEHQKINAVVELVFHYFDVQHQKQEFTFTPIKIEEISLPKTQDFLVKGSANVLQIVPPMPIIESLTLRITEVNTRKKDWDKWLELYNAKEGELSNYLLQVISN